MSVKAFALMGLRLSMQATYAVMKLFCRQRDKVVFISRQSNAPSADFLLLAEKIRELSPQTETEFSCRLGLKGEMGLSYIRLLLHQMRLLAEARACVVDTYIPAVSMLRHRSGVSVTQIWHSMAAIKQFGWQTVGSSEGSSRETAEIMCMHRGYDRVICGSEYMRKFFADAMRTPIERILPLGSAHADTLLTAEGTRGELERIYPQLCGKKLIVYLPTMRRGEALMPNELFENFDFDKFALVVGLHPLDRWTKISDNRAICCSDLPTDTLLRAADAVISDYSGAAAEAALRNIPVYFYLPDVESYMQRCGINIDPRAVFPEMTFTDATELCGALASAPDSAVIARERTLLAGGCDGKCTEKIARLVLGLEEIK